MDSERLTRDILSARHLARIQWWQSLAESARQGDSVSVDYIRRGNQPKVSCTQFLAKGKVEAVNEVRDHFSGVFCKPQSSYEQDSVQESLRTLRDRAATAIQPYSHQEICDAVGKRKKGKTAGISGISNDFLAVLVETEDGRCILQQTFNLLLEKGFHDVPELKRCLVVLLPKVQHVTAASDPRPICLLETLHKVHCRLITNRLLQVWPKARFQFGALPGGQLLDALFCGQSFLERESLQDSTNIYVILDIKKAFDSVRYHDLLTQFGKFTPHAQSLEALRLAEAILSPEMTFQFAGSQWTIQANVGVQQGGSHSSTVFAHFFDTLVGEIFDSYEANNMHRRPGWMFVDDCLVIYGDWLQAETQFSCLYQGLLSRGLFLNLDKTVVLATEAVLRAGEGIVNKSGPLYKCKWTSSTKYLKKTFQHLDIYNPAAPDFNDHLLSFCRRVVYQALDEFSAVCKRVNWCNIQAGLGLLSRYVHSKWLWISPLIVPLQKHIDQIRKLEIDAGIALFKLYIPSQLHKDQAIGLQVWRRKSIAVLLHHAGASSVSKWVARKWSYAGHLLRMNEDSIPYQALSYGVPSRDWKQSRPGPRGMFWNWLAKLLRELNLLSGPITLSQARCLAANREQWASLSSKVLQFYEWDCQVVKETAWTEWYHPLNHDANWGLAIYICVRHGQQIFVWLDRVDGIRTLSLPYDGLNFTSHIRWLIAMLPTLGSWLSFQFLLTSQLSQVHDYDMYQLSSNAYSEFLELVTFSIVPASWEHKVLRLL